MQIIFKAEGAELRVEQLAYKITLKTVKYYQYNPQNKACVPNLYILYQLLQTMLSKA